MIPYLKPEHWLQYDGSRILDVLASAKAAVLSLNTIPFQRRWVDALQKIELKREVAGTSRIEGAEFTERELDRVMRSETSDDLFTRSQKQAAAALKAYEFIRRSSNNGPVTTSLIRHIHRLIVTGADDDHCSPGELRGDGVNVTFGMPRHRGVDGGSVCEIAFDELAEAIGRDFVSHDPLIQAIAIHFHIAAMHPFLDGNGRTARAMEALMMRRAGLRDSTFIAMSNYYYDEKTAYLEALSAVRQGQNDLTPFLRFALKGVEMQARRLLVEIQREIRIELYQNLMNDLFGRLRSPRKRVIAQRQKDILAHLLKAQDQTMPVPALVQACMPLYRDLKNGEKGLVRDINGLLELKALKIIRTTDPEGRATHSVAADLDWPAVITETEFFETVKKMPKSTGGFSLT